jgi:hypothetical protein
MRGREGERERDEKERNEGKYGERQRGMEKGGNAHIPSLVIADNRADIFLLAAAKTFFSACSPLACVLSAFATCSAITPRSASENCNAAAPEVKSGSASLIVERERERDTVQEEMDMPSCSSRRVGR